jgi:Ser/Thr protein kinase RdoA (MazF antagonist)
MNELLQTLSELYSPQDPFLETENVDKGVLSINKIVFTHSKKYFLKQYRTSLSEKGVQEVHAVKQFFAGKGIPVILPLAHKNNATYFIFENRIYALFPFLEGRHIEREDLTPTAIKNIGIVQAKMHIIGKDIPFQVSDKLKPWDKENFFQEKLEVVAILNTIERKSEFDVVALEAIALKENLIQKNNKAFNDFDLGPLHLVHGDFLDHNMFFNDKDEIEYIFDFEKAELCPRAFEITRSLLLMFLQSIFNEKTRDASYEKAKLFLDSYNSIYPINATHLRQGIEVYYLKTVHSLWIEKEHYLKNNIRTDTFLPNQMMYLKYYTEHLHEVCDRLLGPVDNF